MCTGIGYRSLNVCSAFVSDLFASFFPADATMQLCEHSSEYFVMQHLGEWAAGGEEGHRWLFGKAVLQIQLCK